RIVQQLDLLAVAGSGQLNEDWGGPWRYPFALFRWCLLARLTGCKVAFLSVGAGTVRSRSGRFFCATALRLAQYKSVRDESTLALIKSWGVRNVRLVPDMAFSMTFASKRNNDCQRPIAGINPIAYCDP